ncbi:hypothetical protein CJU90_2202 [Yarrowia sp. C11]|nr:hypothetical protein CKK34_6230 [Yarrowia sp. E02]KAG5372123.1 hypothetical protein CJU90_2202 [Yarrowia sp. C11]
MLRTRALGIFSRSIHTSRVCGKNIKLENPWFKGEGPMERTKRKLENTAARPGGALAEYDLYGDLETAHNNVEAVLSNGFVFKDDKVLKSKSPSGKKQVGAILIGLSEVLAWNLTPECLKGLDTGLVEIDPAALGVFEVVYPRPELLILGLGKKSRVLSTKTRNYLNSLGISVEISDSANGAKNFDLLATERPGLVAAALFPPDL